ncbi:MAG TPA: UbiA family prenyltransferase, partial [Verrucomicrobiae bacterium]
RIRCKARMSLSASQKGFLRTLLVLGRVSNIPTVWSNCLAGWLLSGGGTAASLILLCLGSTCIYVGGMYLNDAFDASFDQQHRPERPIPSGAISTPAVWQWGFGWLIGGLVCLMLFNKPITIILALLLTLCVLIYDAVHKIFAFSPWIMSGCRFFLVLTAASVGLNGVTGIAIWSSLMLALYIVGLSYIARQESLSSPLHYWPCLFLAAPIVLALIVNGGSYLLRGVILCCFLAIWILRSLWFAYWPPHRNIPHAVSGLLAGIVLVDFLAAWQGDFIYGIAFLFLFALALLFQRFIPAT